MQEKMTDRTQKDDHKTAFILHGADTNALNETVITNFLTACGGPSLNTVIYSLKARKNPALNKKIHIEPLNKVKFPKIISGHPALAALLYALDDPRLEKAENFLLYSEKNFFTGDLRQFAADCTAKDFDACLLNFSAVRKTELSIFLQPAPVQTAAAFFRKVFNLKDLEETVKKFFLHECALNLIYISRKAALDIKSRFEEISLKLGGKRLAEMIAPEILFATELFHSGAHILPAEEKIGAFFTDMRTPYHPQDIESFQNNNPIRASVFYPTVPNPHNTSQKEISSEAGRVFHILRQLREEKEFAALFKDIQNKKTTAA